MKMRQKKVVGVLGAALLCMAGSSGFNASLAACEHKIGAVLSLTGAYGAHGVPISRAAQLGVEQVNEARAALGVGCDLVYDVRDSNTQASLAVDAARKLIDLEGVTALVGPISSGITAPLLSSVTVENDVLVIATASTSSTFTNMAKRGETKGLFFRTLPSDSLQAVAAAMMAYQAGFRKPAIIYFNNDWGKNNHLIQINRLTGPKLLKHWKAIRIAYICSAIPRMASNILEIGFDLMDHKISSCHKV